MKNCLKLLSCLSAFALFSAVIAGCGPQNSTNGKDNINLTDFPLYNEEYETMVYAQSEYEKRISQPYWLGNMIYNELTPAHFV